VQDVRRRRLVAAVVGVVALIVIALLINSCVDNRHERALRDYNRDVSAIAQSSDDQVSRQLFDVLGGGGNANDLQTAVQQVRLVAEEDVRRAQALDPPDEMRAAQRNLELVLNLRKDGVTRIAQLIPAALSDQQAAPAISRIAGQMQAFLASDVVYSQRVAPLIRDALDNANISGQTIATSKFLPSIGWLDADQVAQRLNPSASTGRSPTGSATATPGTHGHGIVSTVVGGVTLQPGQTINRVPGGANPTFTVTIANQGQNDEGPVTVSLVVRGSGAPIRASKRINQTRAGTNAEVAIPLGRRAPSGAAVTVQVTVRPVPGEKVTDNNTSSYTVLFTS
jgi:hypothetical protein